jgi:type VI secretion system secreted protein Hcp
MAVTAYLVIDGVSGPSTSQQNAIDILSFSFGASMPHQIGVGSSGAESRAGRANLSDLTIMKVVDATSPILFGYLVTNKLISTVTLTYAQQTGAAGAAPDTFYQVKLTGALISGFQNSGAHENPSESISFAYQKTGSQSGTTTKGYDLLTQQGI